MENNITIIWVYERTIPFENSFQIELFESQDKAKYHACENIIKSMIYDYAINHIDNIEYNIYATIKSMIDNLEYKKAISTYTDWVNEKDFCNQIFHLVYPKEIVLSTTNLSSSSTKKVHFPNGATCKCGYYNEYISESNQDDGTYLCGSCRSLNILFN